MTEVTYGSNKLSSKDAFRERKKYSKSAFQDIPYSPIENWNYGRIDSNGFAIAPKESMMKSFAFGFGGGKSLEPVNNAFREMLYYFNTLLANNKTSNNPSSLDRIKIRQAYKDPREEYQIIQERMFNLFLAQSDRNKDFSEITDFKTFTREFSLFLQNPNLRQPVAFTDFLYSSRPSIFCSSLVLDLSENKNSDDYHKTSTILNDENYFLFIDSAIRHGFSVFKDSPLILVYEPESNYSKLVLSAQNSQAFFHEFYDYPHRTENLVIKFYFIQSYLNFLSLNPRLKTIRKDLCIINQDRTIPNLQELDSAFSEKEWSWISTEIRLSHYKDITPRKSRQIACSQKKLTKSLDVISSLDYLEKELRDFR